MKSPRRQRSARCLLCCIIVQFGSSRFAPAAVDADLTVTVPLGTTLLQDIGAYRVGWQSYDAAPVYMPTSWSGHFDAASGISFQPWGKVLGRDALLMHSPWHVPPGRTWVDYELRLPQANPIRLAFGIAMGPDVTGPEKSDGVTFACYLTTNGQAQQLLRQHYERGRWLDFDFDLTPYAGQTIQLRLQVEPGPRNNASFDYSYFGDARLEVGQASPNRAMELDRLVSSRAYRATAGVSRIALSNTSAAGITPSSLLDCENSLQMVGDTWRFGYEGDDAQIVYSLKLATGTLDDLTVQIDDNRPFQPARNGGITAAVRRNDKEEPIVLSGGRISLPNRTTTAWRCFGNIRSRGDRCPLRGPLASWAKR